MSQDGTPYVVVLEFAKVRAYPNAMTVSTIFRGSNKEVNGYREDNEEERQAAFQLGYDGSGAVWRSLLDHELLHHLIMTQIFDKPSMALEHEAGVTQVPLHLRWYEESLVLAAQLYVCKGRLDLPLLPYSGYMPGIAERLFELRAKLS